MNIELMGLGTSYDAFTPAARQKVTQVCAQQGIQLVFHAGAQLPEDTYGETFDYDEFEQAYRTHFAHRGQPGWQQMVFSAVPLQGGPRGWGRLGGDMLVIGPESLEYQGERQVAEFAHIFLHEYGHNLGLTHEGFDPARPHQQETCVMPSEAGRSSKDSPSACFCSSCASHINPHTTTAWP